MNLKGNNKKDKYERIMEKKMQTPVEQLCKGFPLQFTQYMNYVKNQKFEAKPDYSYLRQLLRDVMKEQGYEFDYIYDWTK